MTAGIHRRIALLTALAAAAIAVPAQARRPSASAELDRVIEVERAFASASIERGIKRAFLDYAAADAVIFRPGPVPAVATLNRDPDDDDGAKLDWWPTMGAIARSGDLALSVGPWVISAGNDKAYGYYATVWKKQADGSWKFVIDGAGARLAGEPSRLKGSPVNRLPISDFKIRRSAEPLGEIRSVEDKLAAGASDDARRTIASYLTPDAWLIGSTVEPAGTPLGWRAELARRPAKLKLTYIAGDASAAGDLAYAYGRAESLDADVPLKDATYLHVWQRRNGEWRLIFEGIKRRR